MERVWRPAVPALLGAAAGGALARKLWLAKYRTQGKRLAAAEAECALLYTWLLLEEKGVPLTEFFEARGCQRLAVLGMGRIGRRFVEAVGRNGGRTCVAYGIEADLLGAVHEKLEVYRLPDDPLPPADCAVVCDLERVPEKLAALRREFSGEAVTLAQVMSWLLERHGIGPRDGAMEGWPFDG